MTQTPPSATAPLPLAPPEPAHSPAAPPPPPLIAPELPALPAWFRRGQSQFLIASVLVLVALIVWAAFAPLDVITNAQGEVVPATRIKALQHLEGGIVDRILVEEGALVTKGQPLITLDPVRARAEQQELAKRLTSLKIDIIRLTAEIHGAEAPVFSDALTAEAPDLVQQARDSFATQHKRFSFDLQIQESLIAQRQQDVRELGQRLINNRKTLAIVNDQVDISANLLHSDLTNRMAHLEYLRQQQALRTSIDGDQFALPRAEAALQEAQERLGSAKEGFVETARKDLSAAQKEFDELSQRALKLQNIEDRTVLRSPVDGIVKTLAISTEGGVIQPGQIVAEIVPVGDTLVIEAQLSVQDISYVHPGLAARVTLLGPETTWFSALNGTVTRVSPDAIVTNNGSSGATSGGGNSRSFYRVRIETTQNHFKAGNWEYRLYPGMLVQCSIRIGTRSVAEYLLSPWFRSLRTAFQER